MRNLNPSIHGEQLSPSEIDSRIRGLTARYLINKQMISFLRTYSESANLLYREYDQSRVYPEVTALLIKSRQMAREQTALLKESQESLQREIDRLNGQRKIFEEEEEG